MSDRRNTQPLIPRRRDETHALGTQRVEMSAAGDQQNVMTGEEQTRPDGPADAAGAVDDDSQLTLPSRSAGF